MESSVLYQSFLCDFNSHFLFCRADRKWKLFFAQSGSADMWKFYKKQVLWIWFGHIENLWYQMPRKLGKLGQKMHKNLYMSNLFNFWNNIAKNIFFTANIGRDEIQTFHIPKWISCEGSAVFIQIFHKGATSIVRPPVAWNHAGTAW